MNTEVHDQSMLTAIAPLRAAGFALHWLHPKQKRPIGDKWQDAPVASLEDLRASYRPGNNLGVRLGEPSIIAGLYLHVIDLDIRIAYLSDEAWAALELLLPGISALNLPTVASGSGGASRHLYFLSDKPFHSKRLAVSEGKHRRGKIDPKTGQNKDGWSYDWEIELFGTGKQVAMPPSIHPDTGKPYTWEREFDFDLLDLGIGPIIASATVEALGVAETSTYAYESREPLEFKPGQLERELEVIPVSDLHYDDWIRLGQALHHQFGASTKGFDFWLQHTKRSTKYDGDDRTMRRKYRSFGRYRGQPVTMASVRQWAQAARVQALVDSFDEVDEDPSQLANSDELFDDVPTQVDSFDDLLGGTGTALTVVDSFEDRLGGTDDDIDEFATTTETAAKAPAGKEWISLLHLNEEAAIKPTLHNLRLIVENDVWTRGLSAYNEFTQEIVQRGMPGHKAARRSKQPKPTLQLDGANWTMRDKINGDFWTDDKDNAIRALIEAPRSQGGYEIKVPDRDLRAAVDIVGRKNSFHPVREYLTQQTWDGTERVERLFIDYLGSPDDAYHRNVARMMMIAAVTRVFEPGHKFDFAIILEGIQGKRKSTFISTLARNWFTELDGDFEDAKQMVEIMQGAWLLEIPELSGFQKADVRHIKAFISRTTDKVRLAYARRAQEYPRQCVFIGSTNDDRYLKDDTGGRRYWPVRCDVDEIDTDHLERTVDQLWAEALTLYRAMRVAKPRGTLPLYLSDTAARVIAERLQDSRKVETTEDALAGQIQEWLDRPINDGGFDDVEKDGTPIYRNETCLVQIWTECLGRDIAQYVSSWPAMLGRSIRQIPDWQMSGARMRFGKHGQQRAFKRIVAR